MHIDGPADFSLKKLASGHSRIRWAEIFTLKIPLIS